jgi:hypothetical protein
LVRDGMAHVGLLGFPLPRTTGEQPVQMHWQAFIFPGLVHGRAHPNGFRPTKENQWRVDRQRALSPSSAIQWLGSANWSADEISSRGRLPENVRAASIAVIGSGALGSAIAELLARAGVTDLLVIDGDTLVVGNLVRHTLTMNDLGRNKAEAVSVRLSGVSPNVQVDAIVGDFPPRNEPALARLQQAAVILDTTGSDAVIAALANYTWPEPKLIISASLSLGAKRMYIFSALADRFPSVEFHQEIGPLLKRDAEEWGELGLEWEGIGCWHPVFPARIDDIWLLASATIKEIEATVLKPPIGHEFYVIEQVESERGFAGLRKL